MSVSLFAGGVAVFAVLVIFLITAAYDFSRKKNAKAQNTKQDSQSAGQASLDIRILILIEFLLISLHIASVALDLLLARKSAHCDYITRISLILSHSLISLFYIIFVRRIHLIYSGTVFALKRCHLVAIYGAIAIYSFPFVAYVDLFALGTRFNPAFGCTVVTSSLSGWPWIASLIFPAVLGAYALRLFVSPLLALVGKQKDIQIYRVIIKYAVLFSTIILSSLALLLCGCLLPAGHTYSADGC